MKDKTVKPKAFQCYLDNIAILDHLTDEEAGQLWKLLYKLAVEGEKGESESPMVSMAFALMGGKLERDFAAYEKRVRANRENGKKGGAPRGNRNAAKTPEIEWEDNSIQTTQTTQTSQYKYKDKYKDEYENEDENKDENKDEDENENKNPSAEADAYAAAADVISLFDSLCSPLPKAGAVTESRVLLINKARPALNGTGFEEYFRRVAKSDFLTGRSGKWRGCTLDWLLRPDTISKVLNGTYDDRAAPPRASYDLERLEEIDTLDFIT